MSNSTHDPLLGFSYLCSFSLREYLNLSSTDIFNQCVLGLYA